MTMDTLDFQNARRKDPKELVNTEEIAKEFATLGEYREAMKESYRATKKDGHSDKG